MTIQVKSKKKPNIGLMIGIGVGVIALAVVIYFVFFHSSSKPPPPPQDCGKTPDGTEVAGDCGNINCCSKDKPECCAGVPDSKTGSGSSCYSPKESHCLSGQGLLCPLKNLCSYTDPTTGSVSYECCGYGTNKTAPLCDKTSGKCIDCTPANPACGGKTGSDTPPYCCGKGTHTCYNLNDTTTDPTQNPCVCCGVEVKDGKSTGYGGGCCSKDRCRTLDINGTTLKTPLCCPKPTDVVTPDGQCCDPLDVDPVTKKCNPNWAANYCATLGNKNNVTLGTDCDSSGMGCADRSICYSDKEFTGISKQSPLYGTCSGMSGSPHAKVCVKEGDGYFKSSLKLCDANNKCSPNSGEVCTTLPYYALPSASNARCEQGKCSQGSKNEGKSCKADSDCGISMPGKFRNMAATPPPPMKCKSSTDCPGYGQPPPFVTSDKSSGPCIQITKVDLSGNYTGKYIDAVEDTTGVWKCSGQHVLNSGKCLTGCPKKNATTFCDADQICYESTTSNGTVGYCAAKTSSRPSPSYFPLGPIDTLPSSQDLTFEDCQAWCEPQGNAGRAGRCVLTVKDNNPTWACRLSACEERDDETDKVDPSAPLHLVEGQVLGSSSNKLSSRVVQTYAGSKPGAGTCYKDGNFYGATDISYVESDNGATCMTTFLCEGPDSRGILMGPDAASKSGSGPIATSCYGGNGGGKTGVDRVMCTPFSRSAANLSKCNTCGENKKCVISGDSCASDSDCPPDPYADTANPPAACKLQPGTNSDGLMRGDVLSFATNPHSLCIEDRDTNGNQYTTNGPATPSTGAFCHAARKTQCGGTDTKNLCQQDDHFNDFVGI